MTTIAQDHHFEMDDILDVFYPKYSRFPEKFTTAFHIRQEICKELAISPEVWDEVLMGKPIVPALAEESNISKSEGISLRKAFALMHKIEDVNILKLCARMSEVEARLFWARVLGEKPPIPITRFLQLFSYVGGEGRSIRYIRRLLTAMTPIEIIALLKGTDPRLKAMEKDSLKVQPGVPFIGPYYPAWTKATVPNGVYLDIIKGPRRFLHITEFPKGEWRGVLYSRDRKAVGKLTASQLPIDPNQEYIFEVETNSNAVSKITDIICVGDDWEFYNRPYRERLSHAELLSLKVDYNKPTILESGTDISHVLNRLQDDERVRLVSEGPFQIGGEGGWMLMQSAFHLHLLLSGVKRYQDYSIEARLSVMDGFEPIEVAQVVLSDGQAYQLRERLAREGVMITQGKLDTEPYTVIFVGEVRKIDLSQMIIKDVEILHMDETLGLSDVSQFTDIVELAG